MKATISKESGDYHLRLIPESPFEKMFLGDTLRNYQACESYCEGSNVEPELTMKIIMKNNQTDESHEGQMIEHKWTPHEESILDDVISVLDVSLLKFACEENDLKVVFLAELIKRATEDDMELLSSLHLQLCVGRGT